MSDEGPTQQDVGGMADTVSPVSDRGFFAHPPVQPYAASRLSTISSQTEGERKQFVRSACTLTGGLGTGLVRFFVTTSSPRRFVTGSPLNQ